MVRRPQLSIRQRLRIIRRVIQIIHHRREPQNVGEEDELLPERRAGLPGASEELDGGLPFGGGKAGVEVS